MVADSRWSGGSPQRPLVRGLVGFCQEIAGRKGAHMMDTFSTFDNFSAKISSKITISNDNGLLSHAEIDGMVQEAEKFREEDEMNTFDACAHKRQGSDLT